MPELPEIEHLRRSLAPHITTARLESIVVDRADVLRVGSRPARNAAAFRDTLSGGQVVELLRHGKQLAIITTRGTLVAQLGMTGQLRLVRCSSTEHDALTHVHVRIALRMPDGEARLLLFRDPRRFGKLTLLENRAGCVTRWSTLGPDSLDIESEALAAALSRTGRALKAALLDQFCVAGLGNIYVDEALHAARLHPLQPARSLARAEITRLAAAIRRLLRQAIAAGGSTVRDYSDALGQNGCFTSSHRVYGRSGLPCLRCRSALVQIRVGGRSTTFCPACQPPRHESLTKLSTPAKALRR